MASIHPKPITKGTSTHPRPHAIITSSIVSISEHQSYRTLDNLFHDFSKRATVNSHNTYPTPFYFVVCLLH